MPDRESVMTAILRVTATTRRGSDGRTSKTREKREATAMRVLFKAIGLDKPTLDEIYRCYPWC